MVQAHPDARLAIIGQAPGRKVHETGIPWDDPSGNRLREWLGMDADIFYDPSRVALVPMGFCYPGKGPSGDLPPRPECAAEWHKPLFDAMPALECVLLIGQYAQGYYLGSDRAVSLTETVRDHQRYLPRFFPLPHPSPRNRYWLKQNPWFESSVIPALREKIARLFEPE